MIPLEAAFKGENAEDIRAKSLCDRFDSGLLVVVVAVLLLWPPVPKMLGTLATVYGGRRPSDGGKMRRLWKRKKQWNDCDTKNLILVQRLEKK